MHGTFSGVHRSPPSLTQETEGHQCICACVCGFREKIKKNKAKQQNLRNPKSPQDTKWVKILQVEQYVNEFIPNRP